MSNFIDTSTMSESRQKKSLNFIKKKKEAERIDLENSQMLTRLQSLKASAHLDVQKMRK